MLDGSESQMPEPNMEVRKHVGVVDTLLLPATDLRRNILLFDHLAVPQFHDSWANLRSFFKTKYITEGEFLVSQGIVFEPSLTDWQLLKTHTVLQNILTSFAETICTSCEAIRRQAASAASDPSVFTALVKH